MAEEMTRLRIAWELAKRFNHHWGGNATKDRLKAGYRILAEAPHLAGHPRSENHAMFDRLFQGLNLDPGEEDIPPATWEDAQALSALPTVTPGGIGVSVEDADREIGHLTATGRLGWTINLDGSVDFAIYRPGIREDHLVDEAERLWEGFTEPPPPKMVLCATWKDGEVKLDLSTPEALERHWAALNEALNVLGARLEPPLFEEEQREDTVPRRPTRWRN